MVTEGSFIIPCILQLPLNKHVVLASMLTKITVVERIMAHAAIVCVSWLWFMDAAVHIYAAPFYELMLRCCQNYLTIYIE